jgi:Uma2 family endonuclease
MATIASRIGPSDQGRELSLEEFFDAEEEPGYRYELARGVLEVTEVPDDPHGQIVWQIESAVALFHREHPGLIFRAGEASSFRLWLPGMMSGRNPDFAVVLQGTPADHRGPKPPSLVFEVVSEGGETRDYVTKREEYLVFGIREYWIIDPKARRVIVLVRNGDIWAEHVFADNQTASGIVLPGFTVPLVDLWSATEE